MKRNKKGSKLNFSDMKTLGHQPFADLGAKWGIKGNDQTSAGADQKPEEEKQKPQLFLRLEKRKGNKMVTAVYHLEAEDKQMLKILKKRCASGGGFDDGTLIMQGDHLNGLANWFRDQGYRVRLE